MYQGFVAQVGRFDQLFARRRTSSVMVKIRDEIGGSIGPSWVDKTLCPADRKKLKDGTDMARSILKAAGVRRIFKSWHFAGHRWQHPHWRGCR